jgi:hypothetical protein
MLLTAEMKELFSKVLSCRDSIKKGIRMWSNCDVILDKDDPLAGGIFI